MSACGCRVLCMCPSTWRHLEDEFGVDVAKLRSNEALDLKFADEAWKRFDDAIRVMQSRIDDDITLLVRAGIAVSRLSIETHPDGERRLLVDMRPVQRYTIVVKADEEQVPK